MRDNSILKNKISTKTGILIIVICALLAGGILGYLRYFEKEMTSLTKFPEIKKPEMKLAGIKADLSSDLRFIQIKKGEKIIQSYTIEQWQEWAKNNWGKKFTLRLLDGGSFSFSPTDFIQFSFVSLYSDEEKVAFIVKTKPIDKYWDYGITGILNLKTKKIFMFPYLIYGGDIKEIIWSPHGRYFLILAKFDELIVNDAILGKYIFTLTTDTIRGALKIDSPDEFDAQIREIKWSSDEKQLSFVTNAARFISELGRAEWVINSDGSGLKIVKIKKPLEEIEEIAYVFSCENIDCYNFVKSLFYDKISLPLDIVSSDEKLNEYFTKRFRLPITGISRGKFDKYSDKEIIAVFLRNILTSKTGTQIIVFIQEETKDVWRVYGEVGVYGDTEFQIQPKQLVKNESPFFIAKDTGTGGTCVPVQWSIRIYRLENNKFKLIWDTMYYVNGLVTNQEQAEHTPEYMETEIGYKDLDNDGNLEIIKESYWKLCKGEYACYENDCTETIKEEKIYEVFKWDTQKQTFIEEDIE